MAGGAVPGSRLIEEDVFAVHGANQSMAGRAFDIFVPTGKWESCPVVVVEQGRLPLDRVATIETGRRFSPAGELPGMRVFMTILTLGGRRGELHVPERGFEIGRPVATRAGHRAMRADKRKRRRGVIET